MNVTNLLIEERLKLFKEWLTRVRESNNFDFGNEINFTKDQLLDPSYVIPEWGCGFPSWVKEEKLAENIGKKCYTSDGVNIHEHGTFLGLQATYEDFYYRILTDSGKESYDTCVCKIKFLSDNEYKKLFK